MDDKEWEVLWIDYEHWLANMLTNTEGSRKAIALHITTYERPLTDNEKLFLVDFIQRPKDKVPFRSEGKHKRMMRNWLIREKYKEHRKTMNDRQACLKLAQKFPLDTTAIFKIVKVLHE